MSNESSQSLLNVPDGQDSAKPDNAKDNKTSKETFEALDITEAISTWYFDGNRKCEKRLYLSTKGIIGEEESKDRALAAKQEDEFRNNCLTQLIMKHAKFGQGMSSTTYLDLSKGSLEQRANKTRKALLNKNSSPPILFQPVFSERMRLNRYKTYEIYSSVDFLIQDKNGNYTLCQSMPAISIEERNDVRLNLQVSAKILKNLLSRNKLSNQITALEAINGWNQQLNVEFETISRFASNKNSTEGKKVPTEADDLVYKIMLTVNSANDQNKAERYTPVRNTKCQGCPYKQRCWQQAKDCQDIALLAGMDISLVYELRKQGIETISALKEGISEENLAAISRSFMGEQRVVGKDDAAFIMRSADAFLRQEAIVSQPLTLPECPYYIAFDLEGIPKNYEVEITGDRIYLFGMSLYKRDATEGDFLPVVASFSKTSDKDCWFEFLSRVKELFDQFSNLKFIHWADYERRQIQSYMARYGDKDDTAKHLLSNLVDLLETTRKSVGLPLSSYGLKEIEKYIGFKRSQEEFGGMWSVAKYYEAKQANNNEDQQAILNEIITYNREDLEATWAVFQWLNTLAKENNDKFKS